MYRVFRHSGRGYPDDDNWRLVFENSFEDIAFAKYESIRKVMRQGGVRFVDDYNRILREYHAPRLRTRW